MFVSPFVTEATRGCSSTATAAGAAEGAARQGVWRRPSSSGWRWKCSDRRSEGPERDTEREEFHDVISGALVHDVAAQTRHSHTEQDGVSGTFDHF